MQSRVLAVVGLCLALFFLFTFRSMLIGPPAIDEAHPFDTGRAFARLERILGDQSPHTVDSDANDRVRERLLTEIRTLGFDPIVRDDFHCTDEFFSVRCARVRNVMFWVGSPGDDAVMITSHYDSVAAGPGAGDDGIGIAASLEIAAILRARGEDHPVLILITDGEEIGLQGASSFVEKDPLAQKISAIINMEARGVRGPVAMFETSQPNARDIAILSAPIKTPVTNSLAADIYAAMPNGTDVTMFLPLDVDVGNYAIGEGANFYHTPGDNLENLDKRSLFHMGANALYGVETFIAQDRTQAESARIYTDIVGLFILSMPQWLGFVIIGVGALAALGVYSVKGEGAVIIPFTVFPLAISIGVGFAIGATLLVGAMRPEVQFASANPWALRAAQNITALLGAMSIVYLLGTKTMPRRLAMANWTWFAGLGGLLSAFFPGAAILFAPALAILIIAAIADFLDRGFFARVMIVIAGMVFLLIVVPFTAVGESMLFVENAAPFTLFLIIGVLLILPVLGGARDGAKSHGKWVLAGGAVLSAVCILVSVIVPAYSPGAPRGLSIVHDGGDGSEPAIWRISGDEPVPPSMSDVAPFARPERDGVLLNRYTAPAPQLANAFEDVTIIDHQVSGGEHSVTLQITAQSLDRLIGQVRGDGVSMKAISVNGREVEGDEDVFVCFGRACRQSEVTLRYETDTNSSGGVNPEIALELEAIEYGLGPQSNGLVAARPPWATPRHTGDYRITSTSLTIDGP